MSIGDKPRAASEDKPLRARRVLVTRARHQASQLAAALERLGAETILIPAIEIVPPHSYAPLDRALRGISEFRWLVFTSANAVEVFGERLSATGCAIEQLKNTKLAAVGPATARAVEVLGLKVDLLPEKFVSDSLADALRFEVSGSRVLLVRAAVARDALPQSLAAAGAIVEEVEAYRAIVPRASAEALRALLSENPLRLDAVAFTSSSTAKNFFALVEAAGRSVPPELALASIGPITSRTLRDMGRAPDVEAENATVEALAEALGRHFRPAKI